MLSQEVIVLLLQHHISVLKVIDLTSEVIHHRLHSLSLSYKGIHLILILSLARFHFLYLESSIFG